jgi:hypothetical protein
LITPSTRRYSPAVRRGSVAIWRRPLGWVLAAAAAVRIAFVAFAAHAPSFFTVGDPTTYYLHAISLSSGHGYVYWYDPAHPATAFNPPGWPMLLSLPFWIVRHTAIPDNFVAAGAVLNCALSFATVVFVALVARAWFGERAATVAAILIGFLPGFLYYGASWALENSFAAILMLAVWVVAVRPWRDGVVPPARLALFGLVLGYAVLVRPFALFLVPALLVGTRVAGGSWRRVLTQTAVVVVLVVLVLTPWTVRNYARMHGFVLVSTNLGDTFCQSHHPGATGGFDVVPKCNPGEPPDPHAEIARNSRNLRLGGNYLVHHPLTETRLLFWRAYFTLDSDHDALDGIDVAGGMTYAHWVNHKWRGVLVQLADGGFFAFLGLLLFGAARTLVTSRSRESRLPPDPSRRGQIAFAAIAAAGLAAVPLLLYGTPRFHVPWIPFAALLASRPLADALFAPSPEQPEPSSEV